MYSYHLHAAHHPRVGVRAACKLAVASPWAFEKNGITVFAVEANWSLRELVIRRRASDRQTFFSLDDIDLELNGLLFTAITYYMHI